MSSLLKTMTTYIHQQSLFVCLFVFFVRDEDQKEKMS